MTSFLPQRNLVSVNQPSTSCYPEIKQNIFMNAPSPFVLIGILSLCWLSPRSCCIIVTDPNRSISSPCTSKFWSCENRESVSEVRWLTEKEGHSTSTLTQKTPWLAWKEFFWLTSQIKSEKKRQNGSPTQIFRPCLQSASPPLRKSWGFFYNRRGGLRWLERLVNAQIKNS